MVYNIIFNSIVYSYRGPHCLSQLAPPLITRPLVRTARRPFRPRPAKNSRPYPEQQTNPAAIATSVGKQRYVVEVDCISGRRSSQQHRRYCPGGRTRQLGRRRPSGRRGRGSRRGRASRLRISGRRGDRLRPSVRHSVELGRRPGRFVRPTASGEYNASRRSHGR